MNEAISLYGPSDVPVDTTWVSNAKKVYDKTMGIIQRDITAAASSLVKENARVRCCRTYVPTPVGVASNTKAC